MSWELVQQAASVVLLTGAVLGAFGVIFSKLGLGRKRIRAKFRLWLDETVGEVVEHRITYRNGGASLMDSIARLELDIKGLHTSNGDLSDKIERLQSEIAVLRLMADERGHDSEARTDSIERRIDALTEALLHLTPGRTPLYRPDSP